MFRVSGSGFYGPFPTPQNPDLFLRGWRRGKWLGEGGEGGDGGSRGRRSKGISQDSDMEKCSGLPLGPRPSTRGGFCLGRRTGVHHHAPGCQRDAHMYLSGEGRACEFLRGKRRRDLEVATFRAI